MRLSIVVPAYNEEARLAPMLDAYLPFFAERYGDEAEFIIVVNGSTDGTEAVAEQYAKKHAQLRVAVEPGRIGKGGAVLLGFERAVGDLVGYVDADGSTPPAAFEELVERAVSSGAEIAIGSRWKTGATVPNRQPLLRRITSRAFNMLTRCFFGLRVHDTQCGAKVMPRRAMKRVVPHVGITRWAFDVDLLFQVRRLGGRILEVPTEWHDCPGSKVAVTEASVQMLLALLRLRLVYSPLKWTITVYEYFLGGVYPPHSRRPAS
jgi:glycosyltransferase involved in cell wall biosynthesis